MVDLHVPLRRVVTARPFLEGAMKSKSPKRTPAQRAQQRFIDTRTPLAFARYALVLKKERGSQ
jgi:hypothetical protein